VFSTNNPEIQLLDDYAEKHKNLEPGQYCGAIYRFYPSTRSGNLGCIVKCRLTGPDAAACPDPARARRVLRQKDCPSR
jgi:hypothetical protein